MKHRVFIALPVSSNIKKYIGTWQKGHADIPVRWITPGNLHITLIPPWYTADIPDVHRKLLTIPKIHPFTLRFQKITIGPNSHRKRLIWIEGKKNKHLIALQHQLETTPGTQPEKRSLLPHITIGRLRNGERFPPTNIVENISWKLKISKFCLMESHLKRGGAEYSILHFYRI